MTAHLWSYVIAMLGIGIGTGVDLSSNHAAGSGGGGTAGQPIGLLLALTKAS